MERRDERADIAGRLRGLVNGVAKRGSGLIAEPQSGYCFGLFWALVFRLQRRDRERREMSQD
jgi:hypothetical protein